MDEHLFHALHMEHRTTRQRGRRRDHEGVESRLTCALLFLKYHFLMPARAAYGDYPPYYYRSHCYNLSRILALHWDQACRFKVSALGRRCICSRTIHGIQQRNSTILHTLQRS